MILALPTGMFSNEADLAAGTGTQVGAPINSPAHVIQ